MTVRKNLLFSAGACVALALMFAGVQLTSAAHNTDGLAGYWALNDGSDPTADSSGHGNDGDVIGALFTGVGIAPVPGNVSALTFDGIDDYVTVAHDANLDMTTTYSVSAWVNVTDFATYRPIAFRGTTNSNDIEVYVQSGSGDLIVAHNRGNSGTFDFVGFDNPPIGSLFHLVVTYDGTDVKAYYDGVAPSVVQGTTAVTAPLDTNEGWWFGKVDHTSFGGTFLLKGLLDEVRLYDTALGAAEIGALGDYSDFTVSTGDPDEAFNPVGTSHTVTVTIAPALAQIPVLFDIVGPNSASSTVMTDGLGMASTTYTGTIAGTDTITACIDLDGSGACDVGEAQVVFTKHWLESYLTGGAHLGKGKAMTHSFAGTVGFDLAGGIVGQYQIRDYASGVSCHFGTGDFTSLAFTGTPRDTATFTATTVCNDGGGRTVTVTASDLGEPGSGVDKVELAGDLGTVATTTITGGNFQVHPPVI